MAPCGTSRAPQGLRAARALAALGVAQRPALDLWGSKELFKVGVTLNPKPRSEMPGRSLPRRGMLLPNLQVEAGGRKEYAATLRPSSFQVAFKHRVLGMRRSNV